MLDNTFFIRCLTYIFISLVLIELNACVLQHEEGLCSSSISSSNDFNKRFHLFLFLKKIFIMVEWQVGWTVRLDRIRLQILA